MRSGSVFSPRPSAYAGCGSMTVPSSRRAFSIGATQRAPARSRTPPVTSLWPFRYFVALCIARSTPSASGCWLIGLANVLSMTDSTPRARQASAIAPDVDAAQRRVDRRLEPDDPRRVAEHALRRRQLLERHEARRRRRIAPAGPAAGAACRRRSRRCRRPRRPPAACAIRIVVVAPCPTRTAAPPRRRSSAASFCSTLTTVGFV